LPHRNGASAADIAGELTIDVESESGVRELLHALPAAVYTTDAEGRITFYNEAAAALWGARPTLNSDKWCGSWRMYWPDGTPLPHDQCPMAIALKENRSFKGMGQEAVAERPDGTRVPFMAFPSPLRDSKGAVVGAVNMFFDISERKRAEEASRRTEQEFRDFVENASVAMHWIGPDGTILWANRTEMEMLGYTAEEYIGHYIAEFHVDKGAIEDILRRLNNRETLQNYDAILRCKDGSTRHTLINSNVLWEGDKFIHTRCFTRDITDRIQSEAQIAILGREAEHRAKNVLATVQATVRLTQSDTVEGFKQAVEGRIQALAQVHTLFVQSRWTGAPADLTALSRIAKVRRGLVSAEQQSRLMLHRARNLLMRQRTQALRAHLTVGRPDWHGRYRQAAERPRRPDSPRRAVACVISRKPAGSGEQLGGAVMRRPS